jgi:hypothetical protein
VCNSRDVVSQVKYQLIRIYNSLISPVYDQATVRYTECIAGKPTVFEFCPTAGTVRPSDLYTYDNKPITPTHTTFCVTNGTLRKQKNGKLKILFVIISVIILIFLALVSSFVLQNHFDFSTFAEIESTRWA